MKLKLIFLNFEYAILKLSMLIVIKFRYGHNDTILKKSISIGRARDGVLGKIGSNPTFLFIPQEEQSVIFIFAIMIIVFSYVSYEEETKIIITKKTSIHKPTFDMKEIPNNLFNMDGRYDQHWGKFKPKSFIQHDNLTPSYNGTKTYSPNKLYESFGPINYSNLCPSRLDNIYTSEQYLQKYAFQIVNFVNNMFSTTDILLFQPYFFGQTIILWAIFFTIKELDLQRTIGSMGTFGDFCRALNPMRDVYTRHTYNDENALPLIKTFEACEPTVNKYKEDFSIQEILTEARKYSTSKDTQEVLTKFKRKSMIILLESEMERNYYLIGRELEGDIRINYWAVLEKYSVKQPHVHTDFQGMRIPGALAERRQNYLKDALELENTGEWLEEYYYNNHVILSERKINKYQENIYSLECLRLILYSDDPNNFNINSTELRRIMKAEALWSCDNRSWLSAYIAVQYTRSRWTFYWPSIPSEFELYHFYRI